MKRLRACFLFQTRPADHLSAGARVGFWLWNVLLLTGAGLGLGLVSLALAPANYGWPLFFDYLKHPAILALNLLPPLVLLALCYGITGRAWLSYLITALPVMALSFGNYYKLAFRDDPVIASDLLILGEAGKMAGNYQLFLSPKLVCALAGAVVSLLLLALLARGRPRLPARLAVSLASLAVAAGLTPVYLSEEVYNANTNLDHINQWSATQQYISRGLFYPFLHSIQDAIPQPPAGYSEAEVSALLDTYTAADIPEDQKVNVVGVMLEAFADFSVYGQIEFQQDVYALFHQLEAESYSGRLVTNIFAGGTVDTERAFLTGESSSSHNPRSNVDSFVWYFKSQGYQTSGDHPSYNWFYNRRNINTYLGFDQYRFVEDFYTQFTNGGVANDSIFFPQLTKSILEQLEEDVPLFSFSVSYQGHGPYGSEECWYGDVDDFIGNHELDQASRTILANYFGSQMDTQVYLMEMVDTFRTLDEPIVLVVFGDHKPWLGNNSTVYSALGIDLSLSSVDSFYSYWSTPYLIWANNAAKETLNNDFVGEGPDLSPCFLMNLLFDLCSWEGDAYMQAVSPIWTQLPVIHHLNRYVTAEGDFVAQPTPEQESLIQQFRALEYYRSTHFDQGKE